MSGFGLIVSRDARELTRGTAFRILAAALGVLAIALAAGAALSIVAPAADTREASGAPTALMTVATMLYFATMLPFLVFLWVFAGALLSKEKSTGNLETLLATPLSPRTLWLAKTAAIVLPGLFMAVVSSALIVIAAAVAVRVRPGAAFPFPLPFLAVCWLGNPLLFSGLGALTVILAMRASPDAAIVPSFVLGFGLMAAVPAGTAVGIIDPSSLWFATGYIGAAAIEWIAVLVLSRGLTKEKVVLSSREG
jgi:ABC-type transport system involved in multi-copper enzyme maturation permease subunit